MADDNDVATKAAVPKVVSDPRFRAGRRLLAEAHQHEAAIQVFASLLQEAIKTYGAENIETAPVFYEYGNALFRHYEASSLDKEQQGADDTPTTGATATVKAEGTASSDNSKEAMDTPSMQKKRREAAAAAAEKRFQKPPEESNHDGGDKKPAAIPSPPENVDIIKGGEDTETISRNNKNNGGIHDSLDKEQNEAGQDAEADNNEAEEDDDEDDDEDDEDIQLSLEMMEEAYSILAEYLEKSDPASSNAQSRNYRDWAWEQQSRVLTGIGDVLSTMERHADAADAYIHAREMRQERLEQVFGNNEKGNKKKKKMTVDYLRARRLIVESNTLIAHELLKCNPDSDVVTIETNTLIVRAAERVDYAREYYENARDELQETVLLMGQLVAAAAAAAGAAAGGDADDDLFKEKENVCYASTLVMDVGMQLAQIDEEKQAAESQQPVKKKAKR